MFLGEKCLICLLNSFSRRYRMSLRVNPSLPFRNFLTLVSTIFRRKSLGLVFRFILRKLQKQGGSTLQAFFIVQLPSTSQQKDLFNRFSTITRLIQLSQPGGAETRRRPYIVRAGDGCKVRRYGGAVSIIQVLVVPQPVLTITRAIVYIQHIAQFQVLGQVARV